LIADANGRATSNVNFTFDGTTLLCPYGFSIVFTATSVELKKDGASIGETGIFLVQL
jgi:hypothetical protein